MGADTSGAAAPRPRHTAAWAVLAASATLAASCAQEAGHDLATGPVAFEASSDFLADVAERSGTEPYRIEMSMAMEGSVDGDRLDFDVPLVTGEVDGTRSSMVMDMGALFEEMAAAEPGAGDAMLDALDDADLTIEMVIDGEALYMRMPFFAAVADMARDEGATDAELGPIADLAELGDGWGRIDVAALGGVSMGDVASTAGAEAADPRAVLDLVAGADEPRELGTDRIRGVEVEGLAATVEFAEAIESQGHDVDEFVEQQVGGGLDDHQIEAIVGMEVPIQVWVDAEGFVRRTSYEMDLTGLMEAALDEPAPGGTTLTLGITLDIFDYGDGSIDIEIPAESEDITDEYRDLTEFGVTQGGPGTF
jgi:hypothetical protein